MDENLEKIKNLGIELKDIQVETQYLKDFPGNPRKISLKKLKELEDSIRVFGIIDPLIVNKRRVVIGGNQRLKIVRKLGIEKVKCIEITKEGKDLPFKTEKIINLALNHITGEVDKEKLVEFISDMNLDDLNLAGIGDMEMEKKEKEIPEVEFTEELGEEQNYVVLYFDDGVDWLNAYTLFGLKTVQSLDSKPGFKKMGVGRVINGKSALEKLRKEFGKIS